MSGRRRAFGNAGERYAASRLAAQGWTIVDRNWRGSCGEIDLVALDGEVLVVVEVKTRHGAARGAAEEAVGPAKAARLLALGEEYLAAHPEHLERYWRVDILAITVGPDGRAERVSHIVNAVEG